jgi:hypothetical protein
MEPSPPPAGRKNTEDNRAESLTGVPDGTRQVVARTLTVPVRGMGRVA